MPDETTAEARLEELETLTWRLLGADIRIRDYNWGAVHTEVLNYFARHEALPYVEAGYPEPVRLPAPKDLSPEAQRKRKSRAKRDFEAACREYGLVPVTVLTHKHILNLLQKRGTLPKNATQSQITVAVKRFLDDASDMLADGLMD